VLSKMSTKPKNLKFSSVNQQINSVFAISRRILGTNKWDKVIKSLDAGIGLSKLHDSIAEVADKFSLPPFLPQLILLEWQKYVVVIKQTPIPTVAESVELNPALSLVESNWKFASFFENPTHSELILPGKEVIAIWLDPLSKNIRLKALSKEDLLALKLVMENSGVIPAKETGVSFEMIAHAVRQTVKKGMVIPSRFMLRRDPNIFGSEKPVDPDYIYSDSFTLQWHVTNLCDLHCKHCYDRSERSILTLSQGKSILDDLQHFCHERFVHGRVCFTGGNPLLYPHFFELYAAAARRGFETSILGNPTTRENLQRIIDIQGLSCFQVSLEGLEKQNDFIRGKGSFKRAITFLTLLREMKIRSAVMLTLTKDNVDQVLPLADLLRSHVDIFTFNRLCSVGEGANLSLPSKRAYSDFMETYIKVAEENPFIRRKDNLINIVLDKHGQKLARGCTGYGCGAAFNFIAVLPDGEVHACRKFPSPMGNLTTQSIAQIYDSPLAASYRRGSVACDGCRLRHVCSSCLAVLYGLGKNIHKDLDPYCFIKK
jgi:selenobiotic family peptide radical SAM maturase